MSFKLKNCNIYISYPLIALLTAAAFLIDEKTLFYSVLAAACHEAGHLFAMKYYNCMPERINFTLFGGAIEDSVSGIRSIAEQIKISASGCAVNFLLFFCLLALKTIFGIKEFDFFISANLFLGVFNILPVFNLDGGEICLSLLSVFLLPETAETVVKTISFVILILLFTFSIIIAINNKYNYSYLITVSYLFCMLFLKR